MASNNSYNLSFRKAKATLQKLYHFVNLLTQATLFTAYSTNVYAKAYTWCQNLW